MTKLYAYLLAALVAVIGIGGLVWWGREGHLAAREAQQKTKEVQTQLDVTNVALRASIQAAAANRKLSTDRLAVAEKQRKAAEARTKELNRALQDNPDWAAGRVPDSVWDAIGPTPADRAQPAPGRAAR